MEFGILGPLEVSHDGRPVPVTGTRQRELLAILLLHAGSVVSADRLMDALWGEHPPAAGTTALRVRVSQLRKALGRGRDALVTRAPGYALLAAPDSVDLGRFERLHGEARRALDGGDAASALETARSALALWRGDPLVDVAYATWAQAAILRLHEMRSAALELRIDAELALGHDAPLIGELQALVEAHPLREKLWAQLMLALYRGGRQAEALAAFQAARTRLVDEIGVEPGPRLHELQASILAQDPGLDAIGSAPSPAPVRTVVALAGSPIELARRLADRGGHELVVADIVGDADRLGEALERLAPLRGHARVAAFTSANRGADAARLAAEQDAAVLIAPLASPELDTDLRAMLASPVCDVVLAAGPPAGAAGGPVLVPFGGHQHDWRAIEFAAWLAGEGPLKLLGARGRGRDASRLLASASLALQRGLGVLAEPVLIDAGPDAVVDASAGAAAVVAGLSERWTREGLGPARSEIVRRARCPVLLVRGGLRPSGLAPAHALTRFSWSAVAR